MADPSTSVPPLSVPQLLGGEFVAICLAFILYGVATAQAYVYLHSCKKDSRWLKSLVGAVWIFETAQSAFVLRYVYAVAIIGFGDYVAISKIDWSMGLVIFTETAIIALVEGYYIWRIWILSDRSRVLTALLTILLVGRLGFTTATGIFCLLMGTWIKFEATWVSSFSVLMTNSLSAVVDGLMAISMIVLLRRAKVGFNDKLDGVLRWIMMYAVNTGAISMCVSIAVVITYKTLKNNLVFGGLAILTGELYGNALLGMLNARHLMRNRMTMSVNPEELKFNPTSAGSRAPSVVTFKTMDQRMPKSLQSDIHHS
ncbi:unnamed protein product [Somion occarium]|uniref:DUF6534 domain-containing protein n=1 Tax=Somion occarium TaxID=3059160 RepID=A0ABP1DF67_9APHY